MTFWERHSPTCTHVLAADRGTDKTDRRVDEGGMGREKPAAGCGAEAPHLPPERGRERGKEEGGEGGRPGGRRGEGGKEGGREAGRGRRAVLGGAARPPPPPSSSAIGPARPSPRHPGLLPPRLKRAVGEGKAARREHARCSAPPPPPASVTAAATSSPSLPARPPARLPAPGAALGSALSGGGCDAQTTAASPRRAASRRLTTRPRASLRPPRREVIWLLRNLLLNARVCCPVY